MLLVNNTDIDIDIHLTDKELLNFALESGMLDLHAIQMQIAMNERKKYLEQHENKVWQGKDNAYYTYLPDETRSSGRLLIRKKDLKALEDAIVEFYKDKVVAPTINVLFKEWMDEKLQFNEITKGTYDRYSNDFKRFITDSILDNRKIAYITEYDLEMFIRYSISTHNLTVKAYSNLRTIIRGMFKYAKKRKLTNISISTFFSDLDLSRKVFARNLKAKETQVFSEDEIPKLLNYLRENPTVENLGLLLTFQTGIRTGELSGLKFSDVTNNVIHIQRQEIKYKDEETGKNTRKIVDYTKTEAGNRHIILTDNALETIRQIRKLNPFGEYMMMYGGRKYAASIFNDRLYKACDKCFIPRRSMHKIRKTYGTTLIDNKVDDSLIMAQMGHSDIATTRKYYYFANKSDYHNQEQIKNAISF